jgi:hypothetical protein
MREAKVQQFVARSLSALDQKMPDHASVEYPFKRDNSHFEIA